jgi:hypothetical protein
VKFRDVAGNESACVSDTIVHDNTSPQTPVIADASKAFNASFTTTIQQGVPSDTNFKEFRYTTDGTDPTCSSGTASSSQPTNVTIPAANTTLKALTCDLGGLNSTVSTSVYTFDNTAPTVTITSTSSDPTKISPIPVTIIFSENVIGFVDADVTVTNGTKSGFSSSGTTYTVEVTPSAQGTVTVNIAAGAAQDAAGNNNLLASPLSRTFDSAGPSFSGVSVVSATPSSSNFTPTVEFTLSEAATTTLYGDSLCQNTLSSPILLSAGYQTMTSDALPTSAVTLIHAKAVDSLLNESSCQLIGSYTTQLSAPEISAPIRYLTSLGLAWGPVAGADSYTLYWSNTSGVTVLSSVITNAVSLYTHNSLTGGSNYYYRVAAIKDGVIGALSDEVSAKPYTWPSPTITGISPNSGSTSGGTTVTITGTNFVSGMTVKLGGTSATGVTVVSSTSLTAVTPAEVAGPALVEVINPELLNASFEDGFTYNLALEYLVVAGGGGGGSNMGGGGGAGGYREGTQFLVTSATSYSLIVGAGGAGGAGGAAPDGQAGAAGGSSTFATVTSAGGGGGSGTMGNWTTRPGTSGGSGGGASSNGTALAGNTPATTPAQGNSGGPGGGTNKGSAGGGGAGAAGAVGAQANFAGGGGNGKSSTITGATVWYAGGGGGGTGWSLYAGASGVGGGGDGGSSAAGSAGVVNTGGGGGGGGGSYGAGGAGGSGVVILAYPLSQPALSSIGAGLTYTVNTTARAGYRVYRFTAGTGTISWLFANRPTNLSGVIGNNQVALSWVAPTTSGSINDYLIQYSTDGGSTWTEYDTNSNATTATITGLTNDIPHIFRVAAVTAEGVGAWSLSSAALTPTCFSAATGGNSTTDFVSAGKTYRVHRFSTVGSGTFTTSSVCKPFTVLVVAGGGGGGTGQAPGGGGAGGLVYNNAFSFASAGNYTVVVGGGGGVNANGANSSIGGSLVVAVGGGSGAAGGVSTDQAGSGGSGGGAGFKNSSLFGAGTSGQGYQGGSARAGSWVAGGGGGGAGGIGGNGGGATGAVIGGAGGAGRVINITGTNVTYAGGGGGNGENLAGPGGAGGGGAGGVNSGTGAAGAANTGGGGGGGNVGGSGVVIIQYQIQ